MGLNMGNMRNMWNMETWGGREALGTMGLSGRGSVPVLQGVAKPTASLWELLVSAEMLVAGFDRYFELMNSPGALEIDQTEEHASNLIPAVRGCSFQRP